jgi:hypothetical protein
MGLLLVALTFDQAVVICRGEARKDDMFFDAFAKPIARAEYFSTESSGSSNSASACRNTDMKSKT